MTPPSNRVRSHLSPSELASRDAEIATAYRAGASILDCSTRFKVSRHVVAKSLDRSGVTDRRRARVQAHDTKHRPSTRTGKGTGRKALQWCPMCTKPATTVDRMCEKHQAILDEIVANAASSDRSDPRRQSPSRRRKAA